MRIILLIFSLLISCTSKNDNQNTRNYHDFQRDILTNFQMNFNDPYSIEDTTSFELLIEKVELYYKFIGALGSSSKQDYLKFHRKYIADADADSVNLDCLYKTYPKVELIMLPSNLAYVFYNYDHTISEKYESLSGLAKRLNNFKNEYNIEFKNTELFEKYLMSIDDDSFENYIAFRIPLIAFSLAELDLLSKE